MAISVEHLAHMLGAVTSRAGVTTLLGKINQEGKYPAHVDVPLKNGGNGGVVFYKKLKADAAGVIAMFTDDEAVIRYIATKEKRRTPARRLGLNPNIPADVVDLIREDSKHPANSRLVRETHAPVTELVDLGTTSARSVRRVLTEGTESEVREWLANLQLKGPGQGEILTLFGQERDWHLWVRLLPFLEESERMKALLYLCQYTQEGLDWSVTTWGPLLDLLPAPGTEAARLANLRYQSGFALLAGRHISTSAPAPHEWVLLILQRSDSDELRAFALSAASVSAAEDPAIVAELNAGEHLMLQTRTSGEAYMSPAQAKAIAAKALDEQDPPTAIGLLAALREGTTFRGGLPQATLEDLALLSVTVQWRLEPCVRDVVRLIRGSAGQPTAGFEDRAVRQLSEIREASRSEAFDAAIQESGDCQIMDRLLPLIPMDAFTPRIHPAKLRLLVRKFEEVVPDADESHWETLLSLADEWRGSYAELLETVVATV